MHNNLSGGQCSMQAVDLGLLRRKLDLLEYDEPLGTGSEALVSRLVDDLIHTTESYRDIKTALTAKGQELSQHASKVGGLLLNELQRIRHC